MNPVEIRVVIDTGPDSDAKVRQEAARQLREMLLVKHVERVLPENSGPPPEGAKSAQLAAIGALVVALAPPLFETVAAVVNAWAQRESGRSAKIEFGSSSLELTGLSNAQTQQLIDEFRSAITSEASQERSSERLTEADDGGS